MKNELPFHPRLRKQRAYSRLRCTRLARNSFFVPVLTAVLVLFSPADASAQFAPSSTLAPTIGIAKSNESITVSWLVSPFDFALNYADSATGTWRPVSAPPSFVEDESRVTVAMTNDQQYFNLQLLNAAPSVTGLATLPLFQFAIFSAVELEITPGPPMTVNGAVHCNSNIFVAPSSLLSFQSHVTAAGMIYQTNPPNFSDLPFEGSVSFEGGHRSGVIPLTLSFDSNHTAMALREIVSVPPTDESAASLIGKERFYNKADMIIRFFPSGMFKVSSSKASGLRTVPASEWNALLTPLTGFIKTNTSFFNKRENKTVLPIEIDIGKLGLWNASTNNSLKPFLTNSGGNLTIIYIVDERPLDSSHETGVRLVKGRTLLPMGLTVASPNPVYIWGNYNAPDLTPGSTNISGTRPAAVIGDAITILSDNWTDAQSVTALSSRGARNTTVNAALIGGIVASTANSYSGGVANFTRFLEDWGGGDTFTYNGSMAVMYPSIYAVGLWLGTGDDFGIYNPPIRSWAFDQNFRDPAKLPPGTPFVGVLAPGD